MRIMVLVACLALAACTSTNEMPLAPNMVRLDTQASGLLNVGSVGPATMKRAAEATLARGYTHFRLVDAQTGQGSRVVGVMGHTTGTAWGMGNSARYSGNTFITPVRAPTAHVGVTVVMYRANEAGASNAFDAAQVLASAKK